MLVWLLVGLKGKSMPSTRITVLLPVKNYLPRFLDEALRSVASQGSPDWRLLVIVDPEDLPALGRHLAGWLEDYRIGIIANEGRKLAGAFNTGMRRAETEFVAILLADDAWHPSAVSVLATHMDRHPSADFFHSSRIVIDRNGLPISAVFRSRERFEIADFLTSSPVKHLLCWRRAKALAFGGMDETLNSVGPDDYDFPWTMAEHGAVFQAVPECLYLYRDHREGFRLTTHLPLTTHAREIGRILRKHGASRRQVLSKVWQAQRSYLRQCLYASALERRLRDRLGIPARKGRQEVYE